MGPEDMECFWGGLGACHFGKIVKNCFRELISWVILRGFFPSITHKKCMKFDPVTVKISWGLFAFFIIFWLRGCQLNIGGGNCPPPTRVVQSLISFES